MKEVSLLYPFYSWGNWGIQKSSHLPKVMWQCVGELQGRRRVHAVTTVPRSLSAHRLCLGYSGLWVVTQWVMPSVRDDTVLCHPQSVCPLAESEFLEDENNVSFDLVPESGPAWSTCSVRYWTLEWTNCQMVFGMTVILNFMMLKGHLGVWKWRLQDCTLRSWNLHF